MATTYEPIATTTLTSPAASVTFSSFSSGFTDIVLICQTSAASGSQSNCVRFNSDTSTNYSTTMLSADGSVARSVRYSSATEIQFGYDAVNTAAIGMMNIIHLQNYSNSTTYKTAIGRDSNANAGVGAAVGLWRSTNAITSITVFTKLGTNYSAGSTFTLYGIKAA